MTVAAKKTNRPTAPIPLHRILREVLRHYTEYRELVNQDGRLHVIDYGYWIYNEDGYPEAQRGRVDLLLGPASRAQRVGSA